MYYSVLMKITDKSPKQTGAKTVALLCRDLIGNLYYVEPEHFSNIKLLHATYTSNNQLRMEKGHELMPGYVVSAEEFRKLVNMEKIGIFKEYTPNDNIRQYSLGRYNVSVILRDPLSFSFAQHNYIIAFNKDENQYGNGISMGVTPVNSEGQAIGGAEYCDLRYINVDYENISSYITTWAYERWSGYQGSWKLSDISITRQK